MINISKDFFIVAISALKHFQFFTVVARRGVVQHEARGREEIVLDILGKGNGSTQRNEFELPEGGQGSFLDPAQLVNICLITEITIRFLTSVSPSPLS